MPFPTIPVSVQGTIDFNQAADLVVTVTGLSTLADKIVALDVLFAGVGNNEHGFFAQFVPQAQNTATFTIPVPYPVTVIDPSSIPLNTIIQSLESKYYFVDGNPF